MTAPRTWFNAPGVTRREAEVMGVIDAAMQADGHAPSYREMAGALGCSFSAVNSAIRSLEAKGFIRRMAHRARAVELTRPVVHMVDIIPIPAGLNPAGIRGHDGTFVAGSPSVDLTRSTSSLNLPGASRPPAFFSG